MNSHYLHQPSSELGGSNGEQNSRFMGNLRSMYGQEEDYIDKEHKKLLYKLELEKQIKEKERMKTDYGNTAFKRNITTSNQTGYNYGSPPQAVKKVPNIEDSGETDAGIGGIPGFGSRGVGGGDRNITTNIRRGVGVGVGVQLPPTNIIKQPLFNSERNLTHQLYIYIYIYIT